MKKDMKTDKQQMSIRGQIMLWMIVLTMVASVLVGAVGCGLNYRSTIHVLELNMLEMAHLASSRVTQELNGYAKVTYELGGMAELSNPDVDPAAKKAILDSRIETQGFVQGGILDLNGVNILEPGASFADQDFFTRALKGETTISEPAIHPVTGELIVFISAPLWKDGVPNSEVVGVVYFEPDPATFNNIVNSIRVSENGSAYMLNSSGTTIAHQDMQVVLSQENAIQMAKTDRSLAGLAKLEEKMIAGEHGYGEYSYGGAQKILAYAPIEGTGGWSIAVNAPMSDFTGAFYQSLAITALIYIVALVAAVYCSRYLSRKLGMPLKACADRLTLMAEGDLHTNVWPSLSTDEIGQLLTATETLRADMSDIVNDIKYMTGELASGNFVVEVEKTECFVGDFEEILTSMNGMRDTMDQALRQIAVAANQVDSGSDQVASGAQALSQGATEQASSIQELAATINEINVHVQRTGVEANEASEQTSEAGRMMQECDKQMDDMVAAMNDISKTSEEIGKIIKTIEDIAFQTNILALNAAVEAARAGSAGKGFAVVADEVRNLAAKSAEASQSTAALIEASVAAVGRGAKIANDAAAQMQKVGVVAQDVSVKVAGIAAAAQEQAASIDQVTTGIDQISSVVQTNSATAEQSAAASEELSSQAQMLKDLMVRFRLDADAPAPTPLHDVSAATGDYGYAPMYGDSDKF